LCRPTDADPDEPDPSHSVDNIVVNFDVDEETYKLEVASQPVAEMILSGMGSSDIIVFGDQIERHSIDPTSGEVV
jgi:hypothetical protein